jgi:hypothetical protein
MTIKTDTAATLLLKANIQITPEWQELREYSKELKAIVDGEDFIEELIKKIDNIESVKKAKARKDFSRSVQDLFSRLFQPIETIGFTTGTLKEYDIKNAEIKKAVQQKLANIRDNKPLSEWILRNAIDLMNTDPNGLIFLEYTTTPINVYPTYKSIDSIRYYQSRGQLVEFVIFEPTIVNQKEHWRIVDDKFDRTFIKEGNVYTIVPELSFKHPFGQCPAIICSNISKAGEDEKLAAIHPIIGLAKEYARDQSFLTLYKVFKGNPIFWRYISYCGDCNGTGKNNEGGICTSCKGEGKMVSKNDVTDVVELPTPDDRESPVIAPNIAGFISPDTDVWKMYNEELTLLEQKLYKTHWGTMYGMQMDKSKNAKTATEIIADKQPLENQLNKYSDHIQYIEWKISEWIVNFYDPTKKRDESRVTIYLGRRYIIESYDTLLERYEESVKNEENSVILDKLFTEYINSKYRNNIIDLQHNLNKAKVEPYLHTTLANVIKIFGLQEAQKKVLFQKFWQTVINSNDTEKIKADFDVWFQKNKVELPKPQPTDPINNKN